MTTAIRPATPGDVATILGFVRELAAFEREPDAVAATVWRGGSISSARS